MKSRQIRMKISGIFLLLLCCLCFPVFLSGKTTTTTDSIPYFQALKTKRQQFNDSTQFVNLGNKLKWNIEQLDQRGARTLKRQVSLDDVDAGKGGLFYAQGRFRLNPALLNHSYVLRYHSRGSVWITFNDETVLKTGFFANDYLRKSPEKEFDIFREISFRDTILSVKVYFIPPALSRGRIRNLEIGELSWKDTELRDEKFDVAEDIFTGTFHLAFAVIFMIIFLYYRKARENFYFAVYALLIGLQKLSGNLGLPDYAEQMLTFSFLPAFELLSVFLSKIILNKEKTRIWLFLFFALCIIVPLSDQLEEFASPKGMVLFGFGIVFLVIYLVIVNLFYLIQGFFQKSRESKIITFGFFTGLFVFILFFILTMVFAQTRNSQAIELILDYFPPIGILTLLITMAVVLGRKNAENHKALEQQLHRIENLSQENLRREVEKQQILATQNAELEQKVTERTREVIGQKEIIEGKNREITDNLTYAGRIQSAILPDQAMIRKVLPHFLLCYIPRDIVSGDFYSFFHKNGKVVIASADCTGHGVSGAFMSIIGSSLLNQLVSERTVFNPAEMLNKLNQAVIHSLNQQHSESNDGMDIALCCLDFSSGFLDFAGANRPLWLIRNNNLIEFKPDKYPIGGLQYAHDLDFKLHHIEFQRGDTFYFHTDGFADQFGGPAGKKLMTKKFKEILLTIQHLGMEQQQQYLHEFFENWKGPHDQVDDVLVMGLRIT